MCPGGRGGLFRAVGGAEQGAGVGPKGETLVANVGDVTVKLQADLGSFTSGMAQAQAETSRIGIAMAHLEQPAFGATRGLREMEFAMRTVAVQSMGATGGIGNMVAGIAQLSLSGPMMLGVLAAFAAFGLALDSAKKKADELTKSIEDERKVFQDHLNTIAKLHPSLTNLNKLTKDAADIAALLHARYGGVILDADQMPDDFKRMTRELAALNAKIVDMNQALALERIQRWAEALPRTAASIPVLGERIDQLRQQFDRLQP